ncbi:TetR/AcrR family transcriptional regulator [Leclercia adecarboxylata]|jgi:AcrR family transcriptional regulator|uniref:TetR/AcrR family transcriptional regulator n=1 Tax=Leclercia adecarboxylata TaxID=83655 RepID=A0A855EYY2_9ENTR|nr:TetR/AcrR family transcriptional regulator [Leclercia adecarboxylata]KFC88970.1 TetR family transcriptional regulator [Leclercia adecarboxylata ATCC 23216 = NBRC 102595]MBK0351168.1 TetR/AcrR family transcriptional regulator [Leclercia adecarboxylata]MCE9980921.1 TetR/AcrR family transcriptional regulator [Leclercia adecarboxylata]MCU6675886.1 TetR/AcrR family transcriptional regulator [Leclercia adecarboxylata]MCV3304394.1 TetR/AcrR family transcriptional regulator [Leclercia adecarboxylat
MVVKRRSETMEENRAKLLMAARKAFAEKGFAAASMDELTASVGLTRGALYHNFGDKKGLLAAVVAQMDGEMAQQAKAEAADAGDDWEKLLAEGVAYIKMALDPEVRRIVLLDGPAFLGDPAQWPGQLSCLESTRQTLTQLLERGVIKTVDADAAAYMLNSAAMNAALWIAASPDPQKALPAIIAVFTELASGLCQRPQ